MWKERSRKRMALRPDPWRSISTPVDAAFADPEVATTISELTHGWCQRGSPKPVGSDRPTWRCRSGQFQAHDLPAPPRTIETRPLLKMSEFGYVQRTIGNRRNLRECGASDGKQPKGAAPTEPINLTENTVSDLIPQIAKRCKPWHRFRTPQDPGMAGYHRSPSYRELHRQGSFR